MLLSEIAVMQRTSVKNLGMNCILCMTKYLYRIIMGFSDISINGTITKVLFRTRKSYQGKLRENLWLVSRRVLLSGCSSLELGDDPDLSIRNRTWKNGAFYQCN